ncbi:MAG: hypothetical protein NEHIOOID_00991 [Holosporales bacterium]
MMKRAASYSAILHVIIFFVCLFGMPHPFDRVIKDDGLIVVEFATLGPKTTAPVISNDVPKEKPDLTQPIAPLPAQNEPKQDIQQEVAQQNAQQAQDLKPEPVEEQKTESPKESEADKKLQEEAELLNLKKQEEKKKKEELKKKEEEKKKKELKKKEEEKKKKEELKKKEEEKKKKEEAKKKKEGEKKAVVNLDNKDKKNAKGNKNAKTKSMDDLLDDKGTQSSKAKGNVGAQAEEIGDSYTAREVSLLRAHISKCWNVQAGAKDAKNHIVPIEIHIDHEGYVKKAEIVEKDKMRADPFYRVAAENAQRSLFDPECRQFPDFARDKEFIFNFNPKEMF